MRVCVVAVVVVRVVLFGECSLFVMEVECLTVGLLWVGSGIFNLGEGFCSCDCKTGS